MAVVVFSQAEALWNECDRATNGFHVTSGELKDRQSACDQRARSVCVGYVDIFLTFLGLQLGRLDDGRSLQCACPLPVS
jgi:hypothetical protein